MDSNTSIPTPAGPTPGVGPSDSSALRVRPGFTFYVGKKLATIADEDQCTFTYRIGDRFRWFNKPLFFERIGKRPDGSYYLGRPPAKPNIKT